MSNTPETDVILDIANSLVGQGHANKAWELLENHAKLLECRLRRIDGNYPVKSLSNPLNTHDNVGIFGGEQD